jgi:hypothetical protein
MILPPTLADYEKQWLLDRVRAGELASTIAESDPERGSATGRPASCSTRPGR